MKLDVYIVKQGSAESKLLKKVGFDRRLLPVDQWKGTRRSRGGYGKTPVAWRVEGEDRIRKLCSGIESILGRKSEGSLTTEEISALKRARRTQKAFDNKSKRQNKSQAVSMSRDLCIKSYLSRRLPSASSEDVTLVSGILSKESLDSIQDLEIAAKKVLREKIVAWDIATETFFKLSMDKGAKKMEVAVI